MTKLRFIILAALFLSFIVSSSIALYAQSLTCAQCGNPIRSGSYVMVDGKAFHPEHFLCASCGLAIGTSQYYKDNGNYYHPDHYLQQIAPKCAYCGQPITGEYVEANGKKYHKDHYQQYVALKCSYCGLTINGDYTKTFWGENYHKYHEGNAIRCDYCGRYISDAATGGGIRYDDGRNICGICKATAIKDFNVAKHLFDEIKKELRLYGVNIQWDEIGLYLVDRNYIAQLSNEPRVIEQQTGFTYHRFETVNGRAVNKKFDIYILRGMPELNFISTAAHELMHVWLYLNAPYEMDKAMSEGSANYASYLVLQNRRANRAKYIIENLNKDRDPIYGDGFRRIKNLVGSLGRHGWLGYISENQRMPAGY